jgi:formate dehydrogenase iron-sulfur subunit
MTQMAILNDTTKCIGCEECVAACKKINHTGEDKPWRWQKNIDDLSASRWTTILRKPDNHFIRQQCRHCLEPACVSACLVGALSKTPEGAVVYDKDKCMGCRYCIMSCPFGIPRYSWSSPVPYVQKCILCYENIKSGKISEPACVTACPAQATIYGERKELLAEAHLRINNYPDRYINKVYGEDEVGGTSILYVSSINLDFLGLNKNLGDSALPEKTWGALKIVPGLFSGVGIVMGGIWWIIERRMQLQRLNNNNSVDDESAESENEK